MDAEKESILQGYRVEIDEIDKELVAILNRRAEVSLNVGRLKADSGEQVYQPFREKEVLNKIANRNPGPLPEKHLRALYREIMSSSRMLQRPERVVYLGPEGTFSYFAALKHMGASQPLTPKKNFEEVFRAVADEGAELGVVPLENSLEGTVGQVVDLLQKYPVHIQSELFLKVSHSIMGKASSLDEIATVRSHPQPLMQCKEWIMGNLPDAKLISDESTAAACESAGSPNTAVIGHKSLAERFDLNILAESIEDDPDNWTRFLVIGPSPTKEPSRDKTSLLFTLPDKPGSLAAILNALAGRGINMTKLESRPLRGEKWKHVFFTDLECDLGEREYESLLMMLREQCHTLKVLGSYPSSTERA